MPQDEQHEDLEIFSFKINEHFQHHFIFKILVEDTLRVGGKPNATQTISKM